MDFRPATDNDVAAVMQTLRLAFLDDSVWGPALALPDGSTNHLDPFWRLYVKGGLRLSGVYLTGAADAISIWTPPGESELSPEQDAELVALIKNSFPPNLAAALFELYDRIDTAHPHDRPHAYLGLLATHPDHRGKGIGQQLLAANLADLDARGIPAYLESTNPANLHRYQRAGFEIAGTFDAVLSDATVTTMWREPRL
jgi:ribosomal protein S18 acetylase RimI-like enzyme